MEAYARLTFNRQAKGACARLTFNRQAKGASPMTLTLSTPATVRAVCENKLGMTSAVKSERYSLNDKSSVDQATAIGGVGMLIEQEEGSADVIVTHIKSGGAADREGSIKVGDMLLSVDGRAVAGMHLPYIFKIVAGPVGSTVTLQLRRSQFEVRVLCAPCRMHLQKSRRPEHAQHLRAVTVVFGACLNSMMTRHAASDLRCNAGRYRRRQPKRKLHPRKQIIQ